MGNKPYEYGMPVHDNSNFFTRHSLKSEKLKPGEEFPSENSEIAKRTRESKEYSGLSEAGVELARKKARTEILDLIENSKPGSVIFIGATSDEIRTKSTAEIYGVELQEIAQKDKKDDLLVITRKEIQDLATQKTVPSKDEDLLRARGYTEVVNAIVEQINNNPDKKIVVGFPLFLKELSIKGQWTDEKGQPNQYAKALLNKHSNNQFEALKDWLSSAGKLKILDSNGEVQVIQGPDPLKVGEDQEKALARLYYFAKNYIKRPLVIGGVGHNMSLDALMAGIAISNHSYRNTENGTGAQWQAGVAQLFDDEVGKEGLIREAELIQLHVLLGDPLGDEWLQARYRGRWYGYTSRILPTETPFTYSKSQRLDPKEDPYLF